MSGYKRPKMQLHREFIYLNYETVVNSLSAIEAGKVDEIIEKTSDTSEGGFGGGVKAGPLQGGGSKKKGTSVQEELIRRRTWFSTYDAWYSYLDGADAFGILSSWDLDTRNDLVVGDTLRFSGDVAMAPLHKMFATFIAFANAASSGESIFDVKSSEIAGLRKNARMMASWMKGQSEARNSFVYVSPLGASNPRVVARLDERYFVGDTGAIEGRWTIIGQVSALLSESDQVSAIRVFREVPPTPKEIETIDEALRNFIEPSAVLGVTITPEDISISYPAVFLQPIAIYR